jgi:hypothetical protein
VDFNAVSEVEGASRVHEKKPSSAQENIQNI